MADSVVSSLVNMVSGFAEKYWFICSLPFLLQVFITTDSSKTMHSNLENWDRVINWNCTIYFYPGVKEICFPLRIMGFLEIRKNPALQSQNSSFLEGPMILRIWNFSLESFFRPSDAYRLGVYPCLLLFLGSAFFRMLTPRKIVWYTGILSKYDINEGWWKYVYLPFFGGIRISWRVYIS